MPFPTACVVGAARGGDIAATMRLLVDSAEPAVVFSSLAHLCVPAFSDACTIDIVEQGEIAYRIAYYRSDLAPPTPRATSSRTGRCLPRSPLPALTVLAGMPG